MHDQLFTLLRNYYALTPTNKLKFPSGCTFQSINSFLVSEILISEHHRQYPPSIEYQKRFWKWAIEHLEELNRHSEVEDDVESEIDSRIYDNYMELLLPVGPALGSTDPSVRDQVCGLGLPQREAPPTQSYITHFWSTPELTRSSLNGTKGYYTASLLESRSVIERGTTGLRTWFASFVLAQYLILNPDLVADKCILELGSGIGFLGIIIASLQQLQKVSKGSCWFTDVNEEALARCQDNITLPCNISSSHPRLHYQKLDWFESLEGDPGAMDTLIHERINPELILGADVAFDPALIPALVATLKVSLRPSEHTCNIKAAILAITVRNEETFHYFLEQLASVLLNVKEITVGFETTPFSETAESHVSYQAVKIFHIT